MNDPCLTVVEREQQVLSVPVDFDDATPGQFNLHRAGRVCHGQPLGARMDRDADDPSSHDQRGEVTPDGLDLRQLRQRRSLQRSHVAPRCPDLLVEVERDSELHRGHEATRNLAHIV